MTILEKLQAMWIIATNLKDSELKQLVTFHNALVCIRGRGEVQMVVLDKFGRKWVA